MLKPIKPLTNPISLAAATVLSVLLAAPVVGQVDSVSILLPASQTTGGVSPASPIGAYGFVRASASASGTDTFYVAGFNSTGQDLRSVVTNGTSTPTITRLIQNTAWTTFLKDGDLTRGGGTPTPSSLVFNKTAIAGSSIGAYGAAFIADAGANVTIGGTVQPNLSQKLYRYNLALDANGDAREEFTSLVTYGQMLSAANLTSGSTNVGRQVALSTDSSKVYFVDTSGSATSPAFGGLWRVNSLGGGVTRLFADTELGAEPSVAAVNGVDRVYLNGTTASGNTGGLDYYDTATGSRATAVAAAKLADFLETTTANITIASTATDDAGNVYLLNSKSVTGTERRGVYRLDTAGRLSKVYSYAERNSVTGGTNSNAFRLQTRAATVNGQAITQVLFQEPSSLNAVAAANAFKAGDFNRDGTANQSDVALFKSKLTTRGVAVLLADARYDLNGNNVVDWKDVKVLQQFLPIVDGDADMDYDVDRADLDTLAVNYTPMAGALASGTKTWLAGDFTGDNYASYDDLLILVGNYGERPIYPTLIAGGIYTNDFVVDYYRAIAQSVPEPTTLAALAGVAVIGLRRRRMI